jgi:cytidylate kinase
MPVVTIRGQFGSGAPEIGRQTAERLHVDYVDRRIIADVAARLRRQEQDIEEKENPPGTLLGKIAEALSHTTAFEAGGLPSAFVGVGIPAAFEGVSMPAYQIPIDDTRYLQTLESIIKELASTHSIVIRGRGSQFILKDFPGALHVLVVAPLPIRIKRVMDSMKLDEEAAKQEITRFDNGVSAFTKKYFHAQLMDPEYYDLIINTEHLSFEAATSLVLNALPFKDPTISGQASTV